MTILAIVTCLLSLVVISALAMMWSGYNRLVMLDSRCEAALSDVDVQLKHRHGLLPNLVETVKGFASQERTVLEQVTAARGRALGARTEESRVEAESDLSGRVQMLLTVAEKYPELQSDRHFRNLAQEIADAEHKIAAARRYHNSTVKEYNASLRQFPNNLIAGRMSLGQRAHYDLGMERIFVEEAPTVKF